MRARRTRIDWLRVTVWSAIVALSIAFWLLAAIGLRAVLTTTC